jgi:hypothetical protein
MTRESVLNLKNERPWRGRRLRAAARLILTASCQLGMALPLFAAGQSISHATSSTVTLPEPIYWKQSLFQIPYQWGSAAEPGAAQLVLLFVSKDRGVSWHKISEAKPSVTSFNYRAEGEGEYWFAVQTLDRQGRPWPAGAYQTELRVIVDTTMPQITELRATHRPGGPVEIQWGGADLHLDAGSWRIEVQYEVNGPWEQVCAART